MNYKRERHSGSFTVAMDVNSVSVWYSEELEKKQKQQREFEDFIETHKRQKASSEATLAEQKRKVAPAFKLFFDGLVMILLHRILKCYRSISHGDSPLGVHLE